MSCALIKMSGTNKSNDRIISSWQFEIARIVHSNRQKGMTNVERYGEEKAKELSIKKIASNKRRITTDQARANMSTSHQGFRHTEDSRKKMVISQSKRTDERLSEEHKKIFCRFGKKHTEASKKKISDTTKGRKQSKERVLKTCRKWLITFPDGHEEEILGLKNFCYENNLSYSMMLGIAKGKYKHHKGFKCKKLD